MSLLDDVVAVLEPDRPVDRGAVAEALLEIDVDDIRAEARQRVTWELWDRTTPINGVPAEQVMARPDYQGGEVYLIIVDGVIRYLQLHHPEGGPMPPDGVDAVADQHVEVVVDRLTIETVGARVAERLPEPPPAPRPLPNDNVAPEPNQQPSPFAGDQPRPTPAPGEVQTAEELEEYVEYPPFQPGGRPLIQRRGGGPPRPHREPGDG